MTEILAWFLNLTASERKRVMRAVRVLHSAGYGPKENCLEAIYFARLNSGNQTRAFASVR